LNERSFGDERSGTDLDIPGAKMKQKQMHLGTVMKRINILAWEVMRMI
jgi:hypothetical protein